MAVGAFQFVLTGSGIPHFSAMSEGDRHRTIALVEKTIMEVIAGIIVSGSPLSDRHETGDPRGCYHLKA